MNLANSFSAAMLPHTAGEDPRWIKGNLQVRGMTVAEVQAEIARTGLQSFVGHADTAALLTGILGTEVPMVRGRLVLDHHIDSVVVAQYSGPRLPEGTTTLPEGAEFYFIEFLWASDVP